MGNALSNTIFGNTKKLRQGTIVGLAKGISNLFKRFTGNGITDAQVEQNEFNAIQSQINRDYQTEMSNTAYQRSVNDMKLAGINPALMYGSGSAATTPSGSTALTGSAPQFESFASAIQMMQLPKQLELIESQIAANNANAGKVAEETESEKVRRKQMLAEIGHIQSDIELKLSQSNLTDSQREHLELATSWLNRLNEATLNSVEAKTALDVATKNRIDKLLIGEMKLQDATLENFNRQWEKISSEIGKIADEQNLLQRDLEDYALNRYSNGIFGSGISLQNIIREGLSSRKKIERSVNEYEDVLNRKKREKRAKDSTFRASLRKSYEEYLKNGKVF